MRKILIGLFYLVMSASIIAGTSQFYGGELKQSTAVTIPVGPFEDDAGDGVLVTVTPNDMNATFVYSNGTQVENTDLSAATNLLTIINGTDPDAWATILITAANTANLGPLVMTLWDDGANVCEPITYRFEVVTSDYYNTRYTASTIATVANIATGIWQDTTAGDFTTASSIGKSLYTSGNVPGADGGLFIAGTNAATTITSASGVPLTLSSTGGNNPGLLVLGNGTADGATLTGGATGHGLGLIGGASSGSGLYAYAANSGNGVKLLGAGANAGFLSTGGNNAAGHGMQLTRGNASADDLKLTNSDAPTIGSAISVDSTFLSVLYQYIVQYSNGL